ncbi:PAS domain-containing sensor histidine kinase [Mesorhizobium sangaii]|uniref:histidine kinase n=1 Tax=Mesorhizobium sangaii TaxID=505389 RepID=A0A841PCF2_9HYPH|nr:PAS domain-containing sensor histidine kinase [Mesorhizobium sangaii]MBB6412826.1 hypothetical protein [Mesorhizobium sangaii]
MKAQPLLRKYGSTIAICGAGLLVFWLSSELAETAGPNTYVRMTLLAVTAILTGFLIQGPQGQGALDRAGYDAPEFLEGIPGLAWIVDPEGRLTKASTSLRAYLGTVDTSNLHCRQVIHPEDFDRTAGLMSQCLENGQEFHGAYRLRRHDGAYRWFRVAACARHDRNGKFIGWYGILLDIDDLKKVEQALGAREFQLQRLIDALPTLVWSARPDGSTEFLSRRWHEYTALSQEQAAGWGWTAAIHPDDRDRLVEYWRSLLAAGAPGEIEARLRRFDGQYRWFLFQGEPMRDASGTVIQWFGSNTDIDDRKRTEEALRARQYELQQLIDTIPTLVWSVTPEGEPAYINKQLETYYGRKIDPSPPKEGSKLDGALGRLMHPDDLEAVKRNLMHSLKTGEPFAMRYRNRRGDGVYRWVDNRAMPLRDDDGRIVKWYGVIIDIDDEMRAHDAVRATQDKLSRASQLASLAELSASIAHEVNQPLAAVITDSHACQRWLSADPPNLQRARITAERIVRDSMAAAEVVGRIRALFIQTASSRTSINLNEVIGEVRQLLFDEIISQDIFVGTDLDPALPPVLADRVQMQQVLVNLVRNGIDAMKSTIDVSKSLKFGSRRYGENEILVDVRDNGDGIAEPERIFEPFFTTKAEGMGMGLAICRSILESHDGRLWAESIEPRGTVFSFTLPIQSGDAA